MIRATAEASNTKRGAFNEATSTLPVLANQRFRGWLKCSTVSLCSQSSQIGKSLSSPLTRFATTGLLQIHQGLLTQTAVRSTCPQLEEVMQRIREVADLKGGHEAQAVDACILLANCMLAMALGDAVETAAARARAGGPGHRSSGDVLRQGPAKIIQRFFSNSVQTKQKIGRFWWGPQHHSDRGRRI